MVQNIVLITAGPLDVGSENIVLAIAFGLDQVRVSFVGQVSLWSELLSWGWTVFQNPTLELLYR